MSRRVIEEDAPRLWRSGTLPQLPPAELQRLVGAFLARSEAIFSPEPTVPQREGFLGKRILLSTATDPTT